MSRPEQEPKMWDLHDLARLNTLGMEMGVGATVVSNWQARFKTFPDPVVVIGKTRIYSRKQVIRWWIKNRLPEGVTDMVREVADEDDRRS